MRRVSDTSVARSRRSWGKGRTFRNGATPSQQTNYPVECSSTDRETLQEVGRIIQPGDKVVVVLDSDHSKAHVLRELELYGPLVTPSSYVVATDGNMEELYDVPGGKQEWSTDNPCAAVRDFLLSHPEFEIDPEPTRLGSTYWPRAYLKRQ